MIRKTRIEDIPAVIAIVDEAKAYFKAQGIPQWQNGTPNEEMIENDIAKGYSYVLIEDGEVIGTACIIEEADPDYSRITEGSWLNDEPYTVVHRIAVKSSCKGNGHAAKLLQYAEETALKNGWNNVRIDTHERNSSMRRLLSKNGFVQCGNVEIGPLKEPRIAYQKILKKDHD